MTQNTMKSGGYTITWKASYDLHATIKSTLHKTVKNHGSKGLTALMAALRESKHKDAVLSVVQDLAPSHTAEVSA